MFARLVALYNLCQPQITSKTTPAVAAGLAKEKRSFERRSREAAKALVHERRKNHDKGRETVAGTFGAKFLIIRKRVLAFEAAFFGAAMIGLGTCWYVSDAKSDPGPIVYLFPVSFAVVIGTYPTLAYLLNRWVTAFDVRNCPSCETFLWPTTLHATTVATFGRCSRCWCRLVDPPQSTAGKDA